MKNYDQTSNNHLSSKQFFIGIFLMLLSAKIFAQNSGTIVVGGDINTFYPVSFYDAGFDLNKNTHLSLGRSNVHADSDWRGTLIAEFTYHTDNWGHGAHFIDAHISTGQTSIAIYKSYIAGWQDATSGNGDKRIIIWLRGGGTTYSYFSETNVNPHVFDGVQNALPYSSSNGDVVLQVKTAVDPYVNELGINSSFPVNFYGTASNFMQGNLGIGIRNPTDKLAVNGTIRSKEIRVEAGPWPDYVFEKSYNLPSLQETERFIKTHKHLPNVPAAKEVEANGVALGAMNSLLLQKIEELTLHLIEKDKEIDRLKKQADDVEKWRLKMESAIQKLSKTK